MQLEGKKMVEVALVFNRHGVGLQWHRPNGKCSHGGIGDDRGLWEFLWANRKEVGGVAHTHPWDGPAGPSGTDVTTFSAIERGLGVKLVWPIVTLTEIGYFEWVGPDKHDYGDMRLRRFRLDPADIAELRELSLKGDNGNG